MSRSLSLRVPFRFALILSLVGVVGCGGGGKKKVIVKGKVILPPKVTLVKEQGQADSIKVTLTPVDGGNSESGDANLDDFTFTIRGSEGKGVPAGKYKVSVKVEPYGGRPDAAKRKPELAAAFGPFDPAKTTLEVELPEDSSEQTITVDLEKKSVTK